MTDDPTARQGPLDIRSAWANGVPPMQWLARPWLGRGEIHNLIGQDGVGKSLLALDWAIGLATGTDLIGGLARASSACRVIYVDRDSGAGQTLRRIMALLRGRFGDTPPESAWTNLYIYCDTTMMFHGEGFETLRRVISDVSPDIIFFDALRAMHDLNEDSSKDMAFVYRRVLRPIATSGPAIVLLHHEPKPSERLVGQSLSMRARGSTEIPAAADTNMRYYKAAPGHVLEMGKARNIAGAERPEPLVISLTVAPDGGYRINARRL